MGRLNDCPSFDHLRSLHTCRRCTELLIFILRLNARYTSPWRLEDALLVPAGLPVPVVAEKRVYMNAVLRDAAQRRCVHELPFRDLGVFRVAAVSSQQKTQKSDQR